MKLICFLEASDEKEKERKSTKEKVYQTY